MKLKMPPPSTVAELLVKVLPLTVAVPSLDRPPPLAAELPVKVLSQTVAVPELYRPLTFPLQTSPPAM
jgi:hypothetical protein